MKFNKSFAALNITSMKKFKCFVGIFLATFITFSGVSMVTDTDNDNDDIGVVFVGSGAAYFGIDFKINK